MSKLFVTLFIAGFGLLNSVDAKECVHIQNGKGGYDCMKFSSAERQAVAKFGLRIGESIATVNRLLVRQQWSVDQDWLQAEKVNSIAQPEGSQMICGNGLDAICNKVYRRGKQHLYLTFSKNADVLIGVSTKPL